MPRRKKESQSLKSSIGAESQERSAMKAVGVGETQIAKQAKLFSMSSREEVETR